MVRKLAGRSLSLSCSSPPAEMITRKGDQCQWREMEERREKIEEAPGTERERE